MTARSVLLPGEKAEDLAAHQQHFIDSFQPRHAVELAIVERMARISGGLIGPSAGRVCELPSGCGTSRLKRPRKSKTKPSSWGAGCSGSRRFRCRSAGGSPWEKSPSRSAPRAPSIRITRPGCGCGWSRRFLAATG